MSGENYAIGSRAFLELQRAKAIEASKKIAMEFHNWVGMSGFNQFGIGRWVHLDDQESNRNGEMKFYTDDHVYNEYLKSKQP